jgi:hypothetical protein
MLTRIDGMWSVNNFGGAPGQAFENGARFWSNPSYSVKPLVSANSSLSAKDIHVAVGVRQIGAIPYPGPVCVLVIETKVKPSSSGSAVPRILGQAVSAIQSIQQSRTFCSFVIPASQKYTYSLVVYSCEKSVPPGSAFQVECWSDAPMALQLKSNSNSNSVNHMSHSSSNGTHVSGSSALFSSAKASNSGVHASSASHHSASTSSSSSSASRRF